LGKLSGLNKSGLHVAPCQKAEHLWGIRSLKGKWATGSPNVRKLNIVRELSDSRKVGYM